VGGDSATGAQRACACEPACAGRGGADEDEDADDADGLSKAEQGVIREVCEMGFERAAVLEVVQGLKGRGKEISNDSVAERMLDL
jgi:hypothetical protein